MSRYDYALIKENKYYDPEGLNIDENDDNVLYVGTKDDCERELYYLRGIYKEKYNKDKDVEISEVQNNCFDVYYRNAISRDYYRVVEMHPKKVKDTKKDIYTQIAEWIISQNVNRVLRSKDIKEIAETLFDTKLTDRGVQKVKEALLDRNYTNIKDSVFSYKRGDIVNVPGQDDIKGKILKITGDTVVVEYEAKSGITRKDYYYKEEICKANNCKLEDSNSLVGKKISWDRRALYGVILSENDPLTNKTTIEETSTGKVYFVSTRLLNKAIDKGEAKIYDSKFKDSEEAINEYEAVRYDDEGQVIESESLFFDFDSDAITFSKENGYDAVIEYVYNDPEDNIPDYSEVIWEAKIRDSKVRDSKVTWDDIENAIYDDFDGTQHSEVDYNDCLRSFETRKEARDIQKFVEERFNLNTEILKDAYGGWKVKVYGVEDSINDSKFKDSRLTRKQKLWYAEELEKFIKPEYLRRNYTLRKIRRRRK